MNVSANRLAAATGVLTAVVTALVTLAGAVEDDTAKAVIIVGALFAAAIVITVYLIGSQKHEERVGAGLSELGTDEFTGAPEDEADDEDDDVSEITLPGETHELTGEAEELPVVPEGGAHAEDIPGEPIVPLDQQTDQS